MRYIYFARHGQTIWNVQNKICGATDIELTEKGYEQAKALGQRIINEKIEIDEILYSPLIRAAETARIVSEITGIPMTVENRLKEQCFGKYEGTPRNGGEFALAKTNFLDSYEGGESMMRMGQRIYNLLDDLKTHDKTYLLVAHNGVARFVRSYFEDMTNEEFGKNGIKNCAIKRFDFGNDAVGK